MADVTLTLKHSNVKATVTVREDMAPMYESQGWVREKPADK